MAVKSFIVLAAVAYGAVAKPLRFATRDAPSNIAAGSFTNCTSYETLNTACTLLEADYAYCVGGGGDACTQLYTVVSGDLCSAVETKEDITAAQLQALNPWLDANCDLEIGQVLCVGTGSATTTVSASTTASTTWSTASTSTTPSTTTTSTGATPTIAPGTWTNCTEHYSVIGGQTCLEIVSINGIAYSDFLRWNPEVDTACDNLQLDVSLLLIPALRPPYKGCIQAYCVKDSPACTEIYTVVSGDYCDEIESSYGLSSTRLYELNSWLDSACDLQPGENLCVGQIQ
ncbi:hypothetical protein C8Q72DRAFT_955649 [Fomitopsis betulina]|nr:hypothetical protein C8Q72DRAFT_955649 [Fomitopsis betulina]